MKIDGCKYITNKETRKRFEKALTELHKIQIHPAAKDGGIGRIWRWLSAKVATDPNHTMQEEMTLDAIRRYGEARGVNIPDLEGLESAARAA